MLGVKTLRLLDEMDGVVANARGTLYAAKDARMNPAILWQGKDNMNELLGRVDVKFSSFLWRRISNDSIRRQGL